MNKIVVEKLKGHSQSPNYENSITDSLNFIANKMLEFLKFREHGLAKKHCIVILFHYVLIK